MTSVSACRLFGFVSRFKNNFSHNGIRTVAANKENLHNDNHVYKEKLTKSDLIGVLIDNVVYNDGDIVVTNKPYGVPISKVTKVSDNFIPQTFNECSVKEVLPDVRERLGFESLEVLKGPERYASGVMIMVRTQHAKDKILQSMHRIKNQKDLLHTYMVVTLGKPRYESLETRFAIKDPSKNPKENKEGVEEEILEKWSNVSVKRSQVDMFKWKHKILSTSKYGSLVKVQLSKNLYNSLRLFLALKCLSPVLGDRIYGQRVQNVMGVPLLVDASVINPQSLQQLPGGMLEALQLTKAEQPIIPNLVHLQSLTLLLENKLKFHMSVPAPESFIWTCQQLDLNIDEIAPWRKT